MEELDIEKEPNRELAEQRLSQDFHAYELLLLRRLQNDPVICIEWKDKLKRKRDDDSYDLGEIPHSLWYLAVTLERKKDRLLSFSEQHLENPIGGDKLTAFTETLLTRYMNSNLLTELHLDSIFKYGDDTTLPPEIFKCPSVRSLSLKYNYLDRIPPDIGRMSNLESLALTNNKLQNKSIPYSLTFCSRLVTLMLDNNLLDALPGFLLRMPSLQTVYRHGNHNYFKSTFMWYHTDVNERILKMAGSNDFLAREPERLQFWAARAVIASKKDFFRDPCVAPVLKDYIAEIYTLFNICGFCHTAQLASMPGYKVITFKNPYLGNTCVPFQHWACCQSCAMDIEIPARLEQINAASALDCDYDKYVQECERVYSAFPSSRCRLNQLLLRRRRLHPQRRRGGSQESPQAASWREAVDGDGAAAATAAQDLQIGPPLLAQYAEFAVPASPHHHHHHHHRHTSPGIPCVSDGDSCHCVIS